MLVYQKKLEVWNQFFLNNFVVCLSFCTRQIFEFAECLLWRTAKRTDVHNSVSCVKFAVCLNAGTRQTSLVAVCNSFRRVSCCWAHGKVHICRVLVLCCVPPLQHTAKRAFAVCPILSTRQSGCTRQLCRFR